MPSIRRNRQHIESKAGGVRRAYLQRRRSLTGRQIQPVDAPGLPAAPRGQHTAAIRHPLQYQLVVLQSGDGCGSTVAESYHRLFAVLALRDDASAVGRNREHPPAGAANPFWCEGTRRTAIDVLHVPSR